MTSTASAPPPIAVDDKPATHPVAVSDEISLLAGRLDVVRAELAAASDDFTRIRIRDEARAAAAASAILRRRDIEVEASLLAADAEREVVKHNPKLNAKQGAFLRDNPDSGPARERRHLMELIGSNEVLTRMRQAHAGFTDDEFAQLKAEHRASCVPLTRAMLAKHATGRASQNKSVCTTRRTVPHTPGPSTRNNPVAASVAPVVEPVVRRPRETGDMSLRVVLPQNEYRKLAAFASKLGHSKSHVVRTAIRRYIASHSGVAAPVRNATTPEQPTRSTPAKGTLARGPCRGCRTTDTSKFEMGDTYCTDCWDYAADNGGVFPPPDGRLMSNTTAAT